jgi:hypothetical protein
MIRSPRDLILLELILGSSQGKKRLESMDQFRARGIWQERKVKKNVRLDWSTLVEKNQELDGVEVCYSLVIDQIYIKYN